MGIEITQQKYRMVKRHKKELQGIEEDLEA